MSAENIKIEDQSGDRKYFSIIPHYITNHSTANDQSLYLQMKRYAGESGICFSSKRTLMKKMGIGMKALNKSIQYLLDHKWISFVEFLPMKTPGGEQKVSVYKINDIWGLNNNEYSKGASESTHLRCFQKNTQGASESTPKKKEYKEDNMTISKTQSSFSISEYETNEDGEVIRRGVGSGQTKNPNTVSLVKKFIELAKQKIGVSPVLDGKSMKIVSFALNTARLTEKQILDLFDEWFMLPKPDEELISITRALSANQISQYRLRNNVR